MAYLLDATRLPPQLDAEIDGSFPYGPPPASAATMKSGSVSSTPDAGNSVFSSVSSFTGRTVTAGRSGSDDAVGTGAEVGVAVGAAISTSDAGGREASGTHPMATPATTKSETATHVGRPLARHRTRALEDPFTRDPASVRGSAGSSTSPGSSCSFR